jgi:hypothetical protein
MSTNREARFKQRLQAERRRYKQLEQAAQDLMQEHETNGADAETIRAENATLKGQIAAKQHKEAFTAAATKAGIPADRHDALYALSGHTAEGEPDPKAIAGAVKATLKKHPYLTAPVGDDAEGDAEGDQGDDTDTDGDGDGSLLSEGPVKAPKGQEKAEAPLPKGEGAGRGPRHPSKAKSYAEQVDDDFAATGRSDPWKL